MATESFQEDLSNGTKNVSRQLVFTELSADQLVSTRIAYYMITTYCSTYRSAIVLEIEIT